MRCAIAQPWSGSSAIVFMISRSTVPCTRSVGFPMIIDKSSGSLVDGQGVGEERRRKSENDVRFDRADDFASRVQDRRMRIASEVCHFGVADSTKAAKRRNQGRFGGARRAVFDFQRYAQPLG